MKLFSHVRRLYTADILDTRFLPDPQHPTPLSGAPAAGQDGHPAHEVAQQRQRPVDVQPSKWRTPEYMVYYVIFILVVPTMVKQVCDISQPNAPNYAKFEPLLTDGWIPGRKVDNSDQQYRGFRDHLPHLLSLLVLHPLLRRVYEYLTASTSEPLESASKAHGPSAAPNARQRLQARLSFDTLFSFIFIFALHGISALKILAILYLNHQIATKLPKQHIKPATWIFNVFLIFANELAEGYRFHDLEAVFSPWLTQPSEKGVQIGGWGSRIDAFGGLMPRWEVLFKISILRMISFSLDYEASLCVNPNSKVEKKQQEPAAFTELERINTPLDPTYYAFRPYVLYILYPPLYLAGPILTYNDYTYQLLSPLPSISIPRTTLYALRFFICLLCMELLQHYTYVVAISHSRPDWSLYTPYQLSMLGYFSLHFIWLKLLLPWRFFRLWALADGIDPPENMVRCMSDNYSALAFWRGWHRSMNKWIVRYIYIPLGGSGGRGGEKQSILRSLANMLVIFTFVAIWHDISLRLLTWGWLVVIFLLPEIVATLLFPRRKWAGRLEAYRVLCGIGAVGNILMMMAANLVGFAIGLDGLRDLVDSMVSTWSGIAFLGAIASALFVGTQVMFERREEEKRLGLKVKC